MKLRLTFCFIMVFCSLIFISCKKDGLCDGDNKILFDSFENKLKIEAESFKMASEVDTVEFIPVIDFQGFTSGFCAFCLCGASKYENYWLGFENGSSLKLFKDDFQMQFFLFFNSERSTQVQFKKVGEEYLFFKMFTREILEDYTLEILSSIDINGMMYRNVVKIQAMSSGQLLEELIYQKDEGILTYRNLVGGYEYNRIADLL